MSDLPSLSPPWRWMAETIAKYSLHFASLDDVPPELRGLALNRVGTVMRVLGAALPEGWREALAQQCGWEPENNP